MSVSPPLREGIDLVGASDVIDLLQRQPNDRLLRSKHYERILAECLVPSGLCDGAGAAARPKPPPASKGDDIRNGAHEEYRADHESRRLPFDRVEHEPRDR